MSKTPPTDFRTRFLPYCLTRQPDGRYLVLNGAKEPLTPGAVELKTMSPKVAAAASFKGEPNVANIVLYDEASPPTASAGQLKAYLGRLSRLMKLKVT